MLWAACLALAASATASQPTTPVHAFAGSQPLEYRLASSQPPAHPFAASPPGVYPELVEPGLAGEDSAIELYPWTAEPWDETLPPGTSSSPPHPRAIGGFLESALGVDPQPPWTWQILPSGVIYRSYLASPKESRMRSVMHHDRNQGAIWDITLGGRMGLWRYGSMGDSRPVGFQLDIEGSAQVRLDREHREDLISTDYRFGVYGTWGSEVYQMRFGYYHISSHLGDEFLLNNLGFDRLNYVRESLLWGHSLYLSPDCRVYAEAGFAFVYNVTQPWEFQFGAEYSPACGTWVRGAPFAAVNYHIRQDVGYDGSVVVQTGWAWRGTPASGLFRIGVEYFHGREEQYSFFRGHQDKVGFGVWYDF